MNWNPIWWVHLQMAGGWRGAGMLAAGFFGVVVFFYILTQNWVEPADRGNLDGVWLGIVSLGQSVFLLLVGPGALRKSLQRDFQTGMVESHRLSPMSNARIILGYMTGPTFHALLLFSVGLILGSVFAARSISSIQVSTALTLKLLIGGWWTAMATVLAVALMAWSFVLLLGLSTSGKTNVVGLAIAIGIFGGWAVVVFVPGLALVLGILSMGSLYGLLAKPGSVTMSPLMIGLTAGTQLLFAGIFLNAACTKFRKPENALFTPIQAIVLLLAWGATLVAGISQLGVLLWFFSENASAIQKVYASTGAFMAVAFFASHAAATELMISDRAAAHGERPLRASVRPLLLMPLLLGGLTIVTYSMMLEWVPQASLTAILLDVRADQAQVFLLAGAFCMAYFVDFAWFYITAAIGRKALFTFLVLALGLRVVPLILDAALLGLFTEHEAEPWQGWGTITAFSPMGTMLLGHPAGVGYWVGLGVQGFLFVISIALFQRVRRRMQSHVIRSAPKPEATGAPAPA